MSICCVWGAARHSWWMNRAACSLTGVLLSDSANLATAGTIPMRLSDSMTATSLLATALTSSRPACTTFTSPLCRSSSTATGPEFSRKNTLRAGELGSSDTSFWQASSTFISAPPPPPPPAPQPLDSKRSDDMSRLTSSLSRRISANLSRSPSAAPNCLEAAGLTPTLGDCSAPSRLCMWERNRVPSGVCTPPGGPATPGPPPSMPPDRAHASRSGCDPVGPPSRESSSNRITVPFPGVCWSSTIGSSPLPMATCCRCKNGDSCSRPPC
mmetsp:Transcript_14041/g.39757  ORF Transcript_14041/g.39757 Transcript_14041/m.39757 type:complete len:269 (-) Transcript_14041:1213-2019(-)